MSAVVRILAIASVVVSASLFVLNYASKNGDLAVKLDYNVIPRPIYSAILPIARFSGKFSNALTPPSNQILNDVLGNLRFNILYALARLSVPDILATKAMTTSELAAAAVGVPDSSRLERLLQAAASFGYFRLDASGRWRNTALSAILVTTHKNRQVAHLLRNKEVHYEDWAFLYEELLAPKEDGTDLAFPKLNATVTIEEYFQAGLTQQVEMAFL